MAWVKARDRNNLIIPEPCSETFEKDDTRDRCCDEVKLVTPNDFQYGGGRAIPEILKCLPWYRVIGSVLSWGIMRIPLDWGYRVLAQKRLFVSAMLGKRRD